MMTFFFSLCYCSFNYKLLPPFCLWGNLTATALIWTLVLTLCPISKTTNKLSQRKYIKVAATTKINMSCNDNVNC